MAESFQEKAIRELDLDNAQIDWKVISAPRRLALGMTPAAGTCGRGYEPKKKKVKA